MFRPWRSFPTMVASGLVVGLATGGFPAYAREISQLALVIATTFSLTEISFAGISPRAELRQSLIAGLLSYGVVSGLVLAFAFLIPDPDIHNGWVLMAAVPPAIAVVPITSYLKGDTRRALISLALLYLLGLGLVPLITLAFTSHTASVEELVFQTVLLVGVPIVASRPLRRWSRVADVRTSVVSVSFFFLVVAVAGSTRGPLLARPDLIMALGLMAFTRTFILGGAVFALAALLRRSHEQRVAATAFASFKNLGLTVVLAFSVYGATATLPAIVSLVFEILWLGALPFLFRAHARRSAPANGR